MNLRAGAAGAGIAHLPEVFLHAQLKDALGRHSSLQPVAVGLLVARHAVFALEDCHVELAGVHEEPLFARHQLPGIGDGVRLKVVAKAEVAQHLKKRVVAVGEADVFQIVVLAAGADALLAGGGPAVVSLFRAKKDVLELVHACVGKEQGGIVGGNQAAAVHLAMAFLDKKVQKHAANVVSGRHWGLFHFDYMAAAGQRAQGAANHSGGTVWSDFIILPLCGRRHVTRRVPGS